MYRAWTSFNGLVTETSRKSAIFKEKQEAKVERQETKNFWTEYIELNKQRMKMAIDDNGNEQAEQMV